MRTRYVLGFVFTDDLERVVLIEKSKPDWQRGKLNGVGGRIESGEGERDAMSREFKEEASVDVPPENWQFFCEMEGRDFVVCCFSLRSSKAFQEASPNTEEAIVKTLAKEFRTNRIHNLSWLIPMAIDNYDNPMHSVIARYP